MKLDEKRCQIVATEMTPLRVQHMLNVVTRESPVVGNGPLKFGKKECVAIIGDRETDVNLAFYYDRNGNVSFAEGEKIVYDTQKSTAIRKLKEDLRRVPGCRFIEFHSYTTDPYEYDEPRFPENHIHYECRGSYKPGEWRNALNQLISVLEG